MPFEKKILEKPGVGRGIEAKAPVGRISEVIKPLRLSHHREKLLIRKELGNFGNLDPEALEIALQANRRTSENIKRMLLRQVRAMLS
jgi:hypothetical protein